MRKPVERSSWATRRSAPDPGWRDGPDRPDLRHELEQEVAAVNGTLPPDSRVQHLRVLPAPLLSDVELTGTLRLRRISAVRAHADLVDEMYRP